MTRRVVSITGSRADYGLMEPVHRTIASDRALELHLIVTAMHFLPAFTSSLAEVRKDRIGELHELETMTGDDSGGGMVGSVGHAVIGMARILAEIKPDIVLLQGDRGEMLAGTIAAAHMNIPIVHMSGGDHSGSIDDSIRNAISKFAHFHLTTCDASTKRLIGMGEAPDRIREVGDPGIDQLLHMNFVPLETLAAEFGLFDEKFILATLHPVTDEANQAAAQMQMLLHALEDVGVVTIFTYPNADAGGGAMREVLESWRNRSFLRIVPNLGSHRYLSLLRHAAAIVGNSSSGIVESPAFKVPAVNIGSRQTGRLRAGNVLDVAFDNIAIVEALRTALFDASFRKCVEACRNPYGDGRAAERTVEILKRLRLGKDLTSKWCPSDHGFLNPVSVSEMSSVVGASDWN